MIYNSLLDKIPGQIRFGKKILLEYYKLPEITNVGIYYGQNDRRDK
jgi:hypothetical protein